MNSFSARQAAELNRQKSHLRSALRRRRDQLSPQERRAASQGLAASVSSIPALAQAQYVASYESWPSEPGTDVLNALLLQRGISLLLPALGTGRDLAWRLAGHGADACDVLPAPALGRADVIILPALAVDASGTRLGQGAGWYDRMLPHARADALTLALVYDHEYGGPDASALPRMPHDLPVKAVATPSMWRLCH